MGAKQLAENTGGTPEGLGAALPGHVVSGTERDLLTKSTHPGPHAAGGLRSPMWVWSMQYPRRTHT